MSIMGPSSEEFVTRIAGLPMWVKKHYRKCEATVVSRFSGSVTTFTYINSGASGIGQSTHITCDHCGEKYDLTDYNGW